MKVDYIEDKKDQESNDEPIQKDGPRRILVGANKKTALNSEAYTQDVLIVASKLKKYVKEKHGLNTSTDVMERLSDIIRVHCDRAVDNAKRDGRKTLMDRDF